MQSERSSIWIQSSLNLFEIDDILKSFGHDFKSGITLQMLLKFSFEILIFSNQKQNNI